MYPTMYLVGCVIQKRQAVFVYLQYSDSNARTLSSNLATIFRPCRKAVVSTSSNRLCNSNDCADKVFKFLSAANPCSCSVLSSSANRPARHEKVDKIPDT